MSIIPLNLIHGKTLLSIDTLLFIEFLKKTNVNLCICFGVSFPATGRFEILTRQKFKCAEFCKFGWICFVREIVFFYGKFRVRLNFVHQQYYKIVLSRQSLLLISRFSVSSIRLHLILFDQSIDDHKMILNL